MTEYPKFGKNMFLHTSYWGDRKTFKLMPVTEDCPFTEVIYDPATTLLVVIGRHHKQNFETVPRLDDNGDAMLVGKGSRPNGKSIREQRILMDVLHEYFLVERDEQINFIEQFAVNTTAYDYKKYLRDLEQESKLSPGPEKPGLVDKAGNSLK